MTRWTIYLFFTAVLATTVAHGQCCCGYLYFRIFDKTENKLYPLTTDTSFTQKANDTTGSRWADVNDTFLFGDFKLKIISFKGYMGGGQEIMMFRDYHQGLMFRCPISCGVAILGIQVTKGQKKMIMNFTNVEENDFVIDSIPFINDTITYDIQKIQNEKKVIENKQLLYRWAAFGDIIPSNLYSSQKQTASQPQTVAPTKDSTVTKTRNLFKKQVEIVTTYFPNGKLKSKELIYSKKLKPSRFDKPDKHIYHYKKIEYSENGKKTNKEDTRYGNYFPYTKKSTLITWDYNGKKTKEIRYNDLVRPDYKKYRKKKHKIIYH